LKGGIIESHNVIIGPILYVGVCNEILVRDDPLIFIPFKEFVSAVVVINTLTTIFYGYGVVGDRKEANFIGREGQEFWELILYAIIAVSNDAAKLISQIDPVKIDG
jgi:hypothetical protein